MSHHTALRHGGTSSHATLDSHGTLEEVPRENHETPKVALMPLETNRRRLLLPAVWSLMAMLAASPAAFGQADQLLLREAQQLKDKYAEDLQKLAEWCDQRNLSPQAETTRAVLGPRDPLKIYLPVLPKAVGGAKLAAGATVGGSSEASSGAAAGATAAPSADVTEWSTRLAKLRRDQSAAQYELARRAVRANRASLAFESILAAIAADPDNDAVRRVLGYQPYRGQWCTLDEVSRLRAGQVWNDKYGWLPKNYVARYEQGMRFSDGRWITADEDARLHADIRSGWDIETEHYSIRTNHSLEAGVALGVKLERLFNLWQQIFIRYYASADDVVALFDGRARRNRGPLTRFQVVYFRDREDYDRSLGSLGPNIAMSVGVYIEKTRRAYFFAGKDADDRTLYHEATHQLFHQSRPVPPGVGQRCNFWIVEGIALYMESLREEDGYYVLGGFEDLRMYAAQYRLTKDNFYVPFAELAGYGMERLQSDPRIATIYSQAAGQTHFLVYYDGGRYRDALVGYISTVYANRDTPTTLEELTGTRFAELDKQYREFMAAGVE